MTLDGHLGTPAPESGTSGQESAAQQGNQDFDFQRAYNELRPEYTRTTQELSSYRERLSEYEQLFEALHDSDPEVQRAAKEALGLDVETGSPGSTTTTDDEFVDPLEQELQQVRKEVEELRSAREREAAEAEAKALANLRDEYIGEALSFIEDHENVKFSKREEEVLGNLAIAMADEDGVPNVQAAYNQLYGSEGVLEAARERWIASKTNAPRPPVGTSIPADQKPKTKAERIAYMDERMRALDQQL
jgi:hypothetical protein